MPDPRPRSTTTRDISHSYKPPTKPPTPPRLVRREEHVQNHTPSSGILWPIIGAVVLVVGLLGWAVTSSYSSTNSQTQTTPSIENTPAPTLQQNIQMGNYTGTIEDSQISKKAGMSLTIASQGTGSLLQGDLTIQNGLSGSGNFFAYIAGNQVNILDAVAPDTTWIEFDGTANSDGSLSGKYTTSEQQCGTWNLARGSDGNYTGKVVNTCVGGNGDLILTVKSRKDNVSLVDGGMNISDHLYLHADGTFSLDFIGYTNANQITMYAIVKEAKDVNIGEEAYTFNGQMNGTLSGTSSDTVDSANWSVTHN